ncbi:ubiquinone biosynthesis protein COQ7-domain-containing protein [Kockovaella imperatae]|uniref:5-demethoxyubiquinone hydroxylase, mitochondrial n=1 Tax=Kockovaella imperatae TaxID=4999 RepID=A0A1Y1U8M7_9TREE|nr:ubiquinone biosynthesis protein COQ7-domain-containing protein [Kockovaella imperatae]ORX34399.1 ubiquinone biosynthesis protein COQ7-domain-containing protein [Kockovaella imperatae]
MILASSSRITLDHLARWSTRPTLQQCRTLASDAYFKRPPQTSTTPGPASSTSSSTVPDEATNDTPSNLTPAQKELIDRIIRVDQAGEVGANWIYRGQKLAMQLKGDNKSAAQIEAMWETERHHLATMDLLRKQHNVRPTALYPLWQAMALALGTSTGLMGREAAMACTEAVETVIGEHYDDQLKALKPLIETLSISDPAHPSLPLLRDILTEFRDDELEHLDTAVEEGAQKAPGHALLSAVIELGCKAAIKVCERI